MTNTPLSHPLVAAWLSELDGLMQGVDPGERAEVLAGVREHVDAALTGNLSDDRVRAVLAELGSPQSVADEAYAGRPGLARRPRPRWLATVAVVLNALGLALLVLISVVGPHPLEFLVVGWFYLLPWLAVCVLTALSTVWASRDKALSIALFPATVGVLSILGTFGDRLLAPTMAMLVPFVAFVLAAGGVLLRLHRSATSRT